MRARIAECACGMPRKVNGSEALVVIGTPYRCVHNLVQRLQSFHASYPFYGLVSGVPEGNAAIIHGVLRPHDKIV